MAISQFNLQHQTYRHRDHIKPLLLFCPKTPPSHFTIKTKLRFRNPIKSPIIRCKCIYVPNSTSTDDSLAFKVPKPGKNEGGDKHIEFVDDCRRWVLSIRPLLPGGNWWNLGDSDEIGSTAKSTKPVTVSLALRRIWVLISDDKWVIYTAFASLTIAAVCMPL